MIDRVVLESRHKFIYYDDESFNSLRELEYKYMSKLNSEEPIVIYVKDEGLPHLDTEMLLDKNIIINFHERYYGLLIFLSIIDSISNNVDYDEMNIKFDRLFRVITCYINVEINDINTLKRMLIDSKEIYKDAYVKYLETGKMDFYDKVPIPFVMVDNLVPIVKNLLNLKEYFSLLIDLECISVYDSRSINDYITSRCNGYLSVNVLLHNDNDWKCYYANNGEFIQNVHDYIEIDLRKYKVRVKDIQNGKNILFSCLMS